MPHRQGHRRRPQIAMSRGKAPLLLRAKRLSTLRFLQQLHHNSTISSTTQNTHPQHLTFPQSPLSLEHISHTSREPFHHTPTILDLEHFPQDPRKPIYQAEVLVYLCTAYPVPQTPQLPTLRNPTPQISLCCRQRSTSGAFVTFRDNL